MEFYLHLGSLFFTCSELSHFIFEKISPLCTAESVYSTCGFSELPRCHTASLQEGFSFASHVSPRFFFFDTKCMLFYFLGSYCFLVALSATWRWFLSQLLMNGLQQGDLLKSSVRKCYLNHTFYFLYTHAFVLFSFQRVLRVVGSITSSLFFFCFRCHLPFSVQAGLQIFTYLCEYILLVLWIFFFQKCFI